MTNLGRAGATLAALDRLVGPDGLGTSQALRVPAGDGVPVAFTVHGLAVEAWTDTIRAVVHHPDADLAVIVVVSDGEGWVLDGCGAPISDPRSAEHQQVAHVLVDASCGDGPADLVAWYQLERVRTRLGRALDTLTDDSAWVRMLAGMQDTTVGALAGDWSGSLDDLIATARRLDLTG